MAQNLSFKPLGDEDPRSVIFSFTLESGTGKKFSVLFSPSGINWQCVSDAVLNHGNISESVDISPGTTGDGSINVDGGVVLFHINCDDECDMTFEVDAAKCSEAFKQSAKYFQDYKKRIDELNKEELKRDKETAKRLNAPCCSVCLKSGVSLHPLDDDDTKFICKHCMGIRMF